MSICWLASESHEPDALSHIDWNWEMWKRAMIVPNQAANSLEVNHHRQDIHVNGARKKEGTQIRTSRWSDCQSSVVSMSGSLNVLMSERNLPQIYA